MSAVHQKLYHSGLRGKYPSHSHTLLLTHVSVGKCVRDSGEVKEREKQGSGCVLGERENSHVFSSVWLVNWAGVKAKNAVPLKHIKERERGRESGRVCVSVGEKMNRYTVRHCPLSECHICCSKTSCPADQDNLGE